MSQENLEILRRAVEHMNRTGEPDWDLYDPEVRFTTRGDIESTTTFAGHEGLRQAISGFAGVWESVRWEVQEVTGAGSPFVAGVHFHLRGKGSGVEIETDEAWAIWVRDGKFTRIEQHGNKLEALEAAGLLE
jgi:ketosteroid isomerase-like protein